MRQTTARLGGAAQGYVDPPEQLEQLIQGYVATGRIKDARAVLPALGAASAALGPPRLADRWRAQLDSLERTAPR